MVGGEMTLSEWTPITRYGETFFGLDRDPHIELPNGFKIIPDRNISDISRRTLKERFFSRPWQPWIKTKEGPIAYIVEKTILVSWKTYLTIKNEK